MRRSEVAVASVGYSETKQLEKFVTPVAERWGGWRGG